MSFETLTMLHERLKSLAIPKLPLAVAPPRKTRLAQPAGAVQGALGSPRAVAEITYLSWSENALLRHTAFVGLREHTSATEVRRETPGG